MHMPGEDDTVEIVWAKAAHGVWGLSHIFEGKLYFTAREWEAHTSC